MNPRVDIHTGVGQASGNYSVYPDDVRVPYQKRRFVGIPDGLFQHFESAYFVIATLALSSPAAFIAAHVTTHMGILPDIERVWVTVDHKLFLWDYNDGYVNNLTCDPLC